MAILPKKDTNALVSRAFEKIEIPEQYKTEFLRRVTSLLDNSNVVFNKNIFEIWGRTVYDPNPLHQDEEYARNLKGMNFETTPVFGTLISANGELLINKIANELNLIRGRKIFYSGNHIKYNGPLYPGEELIYDSEKLKVILVKDTDEKNILGFNLVLDGKKDNKRVITNIARFRFNRNIFDEEELEKILSGEDENVVADYVFDFSYSRHEDYNRCIGGLGSKVLLMAPAALVPAGLLKLSYDKTEKYEGSYGALDFEFYSRPKLGNFRTIIKNTTKPKERRKGFVYNFKGTVLQEGKPILSGKFKCFSGVDLVA